MLSCTKLFNWAFEAKAELLLQRSSESQSWEQGTRRIKLKRQNWNSAKIKQLQNNNLTYQLYQFETNNPDGVDYNNLTMVFVVMVGV